MLPLNKNPDFNKIETIKVQSQYYDLDYEIKRTEIWDWQALDQEIEMVLLTEPQERLFNLSFGSPLMSIIFENFDSSLDNIINLALDSIEFWVPIKIHRNKTNIEKDVLNHTITIQIWYDSNNGLIKNHCFARRIRK